jgi:hypothetical protein
MKKKWIVRIILYLSFSIPCQAQEYSLIAIKAQLDTMFSGLDKSRVPTGRLWDSAVNLVEREDYNGTVLTDSNYVSLSKLPDLIYTINSASVGADTLSIQSSIVALKTNSSYTTQRVGVLFKPYNYIVANALTDNLIVYSGGRVNDSYINGIWQNPYAQDVLFAHAVGGEESVSSNANYTICNLDNSSTTPFQSVQFDPGDGGGFRTISMGGTVIANYSNEGYHETRLKVIWNGQTFQSHSAVYVSFTAPDYAPSTTPGSGFSDKKDFEAPFEENTYRATVSYRTPLSFNKPLIVAERFDPWRMIDGQNDNAYPGFSHLGSFPDSSIFNGYNVFYIDWYDCGADIRANAEVLKEVIRWVNANKTSGNQNVILGQSMGGLITRYALCDMERNGELHDTKLFISHDAPHLGANVSPGLQFLYRDLYNLSDNAFVDLISLFVGKSQQLQEFRRLGQCQSVKQMLLHYVDGSGIYDNSVYNTFQDTLSTIGFPKGDPGKPIENICIVNGGNAPKGGASRYTPGDKIIDFNFEVSDGIITGSLLLSILSGLNSPALPWLPQLLIGGKSTLHGNYSVYPFLHNDSLVAKSNIVFTKKYLWLIDVDFTLHDRAHNSPSQGVAADSVRCSTYTLPKRVVSQIDSLGNGNIGLLYYGLQVPDSSLMFIPSASALAVFDESNFVNNLYTYKPNPLIDTPFSSYILQEDATEHVSFFDSTESWLTVIDRASILGPQIAFPGDKYSIIPSSYNSQIVYSILGPSEISINNDLGTISGTGYGLASIYAEKMTNRYVVKKKKDVLVGLPQYALSYDVASGIYTVRADYVNSDIESFVQEHHLEDSLSFYWRRTVDGVAVDSVVVHNHSYSFSFNDGDDAAVIEFHVSYRGYNGPSSTIHIPKEAPFTANVKGIDVRYGRIISYLVDFNYPNSGGLVPSFVFKKNPLSDYSGPNPSCIMVLGKRFLIPNLFPGDEYWSIPLFDNVDIQEYILSVTNENEPLLLNIDLYSSAQLQNGTPTGFIYTITIPIYCH